jgi:hypothetical protein
VLVGLALLAGLAARLRNLGPQILGGDRAHAVRAAVQYAPLEILGRYSLTDYSLPLTALTASCCAPESSSTVVVARAVAPRRLSGGGGVAVASRSPPGRLRWLSTRLFWRSPRARSLQPYRALLPADGVVGGGRGRCLR